MATDTKTSADTKVPVDVKSLVQGPRVAGLFIEFEEGITEPEAKAMLESCNMTRNWIIKYNVDYMGNIYYVKVGENKETN